MKKIALLLSGLIATTALAQSADKILQSVEKTYLGIDQICAEYQQTFIWTMADEMNTFDGKICSDGGVKFRIENQDQIIVTNGKTLWTLNKRNKQVLIDTADKKSREHAFLHAFVEKYRSDYNAQYVGKEMLNGEAHHHLRLDAKTKDQFEKQIELWVRRSDHLITKIVQIDINENENQYLMKNIDTGVDLEDAFFVLDIPQGYEVVDLRQ